MTDFREKDGYKPKISLEYVDDEGRKLCPKEAFRSVAGKRELHAVARDALGTYLVLRYVKLY